MAARFKTFVQLLMAVLALGVWTPQSTCVAGTVEAPEKTCCCCCAGSPICKSHPDKPCERARAGIQAQAYDKQVSARTVSASSPRGDTFLFSIAPTPVKSFALVSVVHQRKLDGSPPFGDSPPQAMLCLWLI